MRLSRLLFPLILGILPVAVGCGDSPTPEPSTPSPSGPTATASPTATEGGTPTAPPTPTAIPTPTAPPTPTRTPTPPPPTPTAVPTPTAEVDQDRDGYPAAVDCEDFDPDVHPDASETCDDQDQDCDQDVDEGLTFINYYTDADQDGYGNDVTATLDCAPPPGLVDQGGDCNDSDPSLNPATVWHKDQDLDGYGSDTDTLAQCTRPSGYVAEGGDCADGDKDIGPGATESCDGTDEDCDGRIDDDTPCFDDDGDGYCEADCADGSTPGDCDDFAPWTYPGAPERFDREDNNCDGQIETGREFPLSLAQITLDGFLLGAQAGKALAGGGDVDGDGYDDLLIGAPNHDPDQLQAGAAFLVMGRQQGWPAEPTRLSALDRVYELDDDQDGASAGEAVAMLGDVNGDGLADFGVGAPGSNGVSGTLTNAGSAYLFLGKQSGWTGGFAADLASSRIDGTGVNIELGTSMAGGDIDGDGLEDFLVGAPDQSDSFFANAGWIFILKGRGTPFPTLAGPGSVVKLLGEPENGIGMAVAWLGDHDSAQNGYFVAGGQFDAAGKGMAVRVRGVSDWSTAPSAFLKLGDYDNGTWTGTRSGERIGYFMAGDVDLDGDGYTDLAVGRHFRGDVGPSDIGYVILGGQTVSDTGGEIKTKNDVILRTSLPDPCPCVVASIGDMNGDGQRDLAIAAAFAPPQGQPESEDYTGRVYVLYGRDASWPEVVDLDAEADVIFYGTISGGRAGYALSGAGDVNGDGFDDLAVGAPFVNVPNGGGSTNQAGRVYIQLGGGEAR